MEAVPGLAAVRKIEPAEGIAAPSKAWIWIFEMLRVSALAPAPVEKVTVMVDELTAIAALVISRAGVKKTAPWPGLNCQPDGAVKISVAPDWFGVKSCLVAGGSA